MPPQDIWDSIPNASTSQIPSDNSVWDEIPDASTGVAPKPKKPEPNWVDTGVTGLLRMGVPAAAGLGYGLATAGPTMGGSLLGESAVLAGSSLVGDVGAQMYEKWRGLRPNYDPIETGIQTVGGAVAGPVGRIFGPPAKSLVGNLARGGAEAFVLGTGMSIPETVHNEDRFPTIPEAVTHGVKTIPYGVVGAGAMHGAHKLIGGMRGTTPNEPPPPPVPPTETSSLTVRIPRPPIDPDAPPFVQPTEGQQPIGEFPPTDIQPTFRKGTLTPEMWKRPATVEDMAPPSQKPVQAETQGEEPDIVEITEPGGPEHLQLLSQGYVRGPVSKNGYPTVIRGGPTPSEGVPVIPPKVEKGGARKGPGDTLVPGEPYRVPTQKVTAAFAANMAEGGYRLISNDADGMTTFAQTDTTPPPNRPGFLRNDQGATPIGEGIAELMRLKQKFLNWRGRLKIQAMPTEDMFNTFLGEEGVESKSGLFSRMFGIRTDPGSMGEPTGKVATFNPGWQVDTEHPANNLPPADPKKLQDFLDKTRQEIGASIPGANPETGEAEPPLTPEERGWTTSADEPQSNVTKFPDPNNPTVEDAVRAARRDRTADAEEIDTATSLSHAQQLAEYWHDQADHMNQLGMPEDARHASNMATKASLKMEQLHAERRKSTIYEDYRLPDGRVVPIDSRQSQNQPTVRIQLSSGEIVEGTRVPPTKIPPAKMTLPPETTGGMDDRMRQRVDSVGGPRMFDFTPQKGQQELPFGPLKEQPEVPFELTPSTPGEGTQPEQMDLKGLRDKNQGELNFDQKTSLKLSDLKHPTAISWGQQVAALDRAKAPDTAYRDIMSTASKADLKGKETWRKKVIEGIKYFEEQFKRLMRDESGGPEHPIITKLRKSMQVTNDSSQARFILPDGTMLKPPDIRDEHYQMLERAGIKLEEAGAAGVIRYREGGASINAPITNAQAKTLVDARISGKHDHLYIDVGDNENDFVGRQFNDRANANVIKAWVNSHFKETSTETTIQTLKRLVKDESGTFDPEELWKNLRKALGREPNEEELMKAMERQGNEATPGAQPKDSDMWTAEELRRGRGKWDVFDPTDGRALRIFGNEQDAIDYVADRPHLDYGPHDPTALPHPDIPPNEGRQPAQRSGPPPLGGGVYDEAIKSLNEITDRGQLREMRDHINNAIDSLRKIDPSSQELRLYEKLRDELDKRSRDLTPKRDVGKDRANQRILEDAMEDLNEALEDTETATRPASTMNEIFKHIDGATDPETALNNLGVIRSYVDDASNNIHQKNTFKMLYDEAFNKYHETIQASNKEASPTQSAEGPLPKNPPSIEVRQNPNSNTWGVYVNGELHEGFFSREAASRGAENYMREIDPNYKTSFDVRWEKAIKEMSDEELKRRKGLLENAEDYENPDIAPALKAIDAELASRKVQAAKIPDSNPLAKSDPMATNYIETIQGMGPMPTERLNKQVTEAKNIILKSMQNDLTVADIRRFHQLAEMIKDNPELPKDVLNRFKFDRYRLSDGTVINVDATASKGEPELDWQEKDGTWTKIKRLARGFLGEDTGSSTVESALGGDYIAGAGKLWNKARGLMKGRPGKNTKEKAEHSFINEALAVPSAITTTGDFSFPGRQGLALIHTPQFWSAAAKMFKGLSKSSFDQMQRDLEKLPIARPTVGKDGKIGPSFAQKYMGLTINQPASEAPMNKRAEQTASRWVEVGFGNDPLSKLWKYSVGIPIRATNRAFLTMSNQLKFNRAQYMVDLMQKMAIKGEGGGRIRQGMMPMWGKVTPEQAADLNPYHNLELAKQLGDYINTAVGSAPKKVDILPGLQFNTERPTNVLEKTASGLNAALFSPGLFYSRMRFLSPATYIMASPAVRKQYLQSALAMAGAWYAFTELAKNSGIPGVTVNNDITNADFGKVRMGNQRFDPGGGFLQFLVLYGRAWKGGYTSSANPEQGFHKFGQGFQAETQLSNAMRFGSNKLNPAFKFIYDLADASQYKPFHLGDRTMQMFVPLMLQDLWEIHKNSPDLTGAMGQALAPLFGVGTQSYSKGESVSKFIPTNKDKLITGGGFNQFNPIGPMEY